VLQGVALVLVYLGVRDALAREAARDAGAM
jgi:hypothetical protein